MVDALNLANFVARNRQAGGINAQLANALSANLAPRPQTSALAPTPPVAPGLFGVGREPGARGDLGAGVRGGDFLTLAGFLAGPATFPISALAGLVANDALGNNPSLSLLGAARSLGNREDRPERGRVSRPDRIRSSSNREAGGGFVE